MQEPKVAFEDIDGYELYPCVVFYSSNPGEKVFWCLYNFYVVLLAS